MITSIAEKQLLNFATGITPEKTIQHLENLRNESCCLGFLKWWVWLESSKLWEDQANQVDDTMYGRSYNIKLNLVKINSAIELFFILNLTHFLIYYSKTYIKFTVLIIPSVYNSVALSTFTWFAVQPSPSSIFRTFAFS